MTKKTAIAVGYYTVLLLVIFVLPASNSISKKNSSKVFENGKIEVSAYSNKTCVVHIKPAVHEKIKFINFQAAVLDTVSCRKEDEFSFQSNTKEYLKRQTSFHDKPALNPLPHANAYAYAVKNNRSKQLWKYVTDLSVAHKVNVVSLFMNPNDLYDFFNGIYTPGFKHSVQNQPRLNIPWWLVDANWTQRGKTTERKVHMQYLSGSGKVLYESDAGLRISGNASRGFAQKSFLLKATKKKDKKMFSYPFFETNGFESYSSLVLRNSGNDWGHTMFADGFIQQMVNANDIDKQNYKPVVVYVNGVYWGIYALMEHNNENYLKQKYKAKKKDIALIEGYKLEYGSENDKQDYLAVMHYCKKHDLSNENCYEVVASKIDVSNMALYAAVEMYAANQDWPNLNVRVARVKGSHNNKWFYMLKDMDCSYSYAGSKAYTINMFEHLQKKQDPFSVIFNALLKNKRFRKCLNEQFTYVQNQYFNVANQTQTINNLVSMLEGEMSAQINRWQQPSSMSSWKTNVQDFRTFFESRKKHLELHVNNCLAK